MKEFSKLSMIELGITEMFAGKAYAYVGVMHGDTFGLGIAVANERGYSPIPLYHAQADTFDAACDMADRLNASALELDATAAARIVCSSMARNAS